jgi:two-component system alkaline phosphatase synthesis response regulator PhoP
MPKEILIVDDDPDFVETMEIILKGNGYSTRTARDGEEALKKVHEKIPDIILLDIMMKTKTDGIWVSEKIRSEEKLKEIPIIMITAVNQDSDMAKFHLGQETGTEYMPVNVFMEKPIEAKDLLKEIKNLIGGPEEKK